MNFYKGNANWVIFARDTPIESKQNSLIEWFVSKQKLIHSLRVCFVQIVQNKLLVSDFRKKNFSWVIYARQPKLSDLCKKTPIERFVEDKLQLSDLCKTNSNSAIFTRQTLIECFLQDYLQLNDLYRKKSNWSICTRQIPIEWYVRNKLIEWFLQD